MNVDYAVKGLNYNFEKNDIYNEVTKHAENYVKEIFEEEQDFQKEEFEELLSQGEISNIEEYKEKILNFSVTDIDYSKSFEENKNHPSIKADIEKTLNKYLSNVYDLPRNTIVTIDDSYVNDKGIPSEDVVKKALKNKFENNVHVAEYRSAEPATKSDLISEQAFQKVGEMLETNEYQKFLDLRASIQKYSSKNVAMIYTQKPDAKAVMGFNAWKQLDRHVDAGQQGISIWQPCIKELKNEKDVDNYMNKNGYKYVNPDKMKERFLKEIAEKGKTEAETGFRLGTVFDVSQTVPNDPEHDNIGNIVNLNKPLNKDLENYDKIEKSMKEASFTIPFVISPSTSQQDALFEAVNVYTDKLLSEAPETVIGIKSNIPLKGDMHKIETLMSTYIICQHIGIESGDKVALKLAPIFDKENITKDVVELGRRDMFTQSFDRACKVSDQFVKAFDKSFGIDIEAQRETIKAQKEAKDNMLKEKKENTLWFGKVSTEKVEQWKENGVTYTVGKSEEDNFYVKVSREGSNRVISLSGDDGKPKEFTTQPTHKEIEEFAKDQLPKETKAKETKKKTKKKDTIERD